MFKIKTILFTLWLLLSIGASAQTTNIKYEHFTVKSGLPSQTVYNVIEDKSGFLWICTNAGLSRFDGSKFVNYTTSDNLGENEILDLKEDKKGRIWFLPFYGKLSYWENGNFHSSKNTPLLANINTGLGMVLISEDKVGNIYILCLNRRNLIIKITPNNEITEIPLNLGKSSNEFATNIFIAKNGNLLILTNNGSLFEMDLTSKVVKLNKIIKNYQQIPSYNSKNNLILYLNAAGLCQLNDTAEELLIPKNKLPSEINYILNVQKDMMGNIWVTHGVENTILYFKNKNGYTSDPIHLLKGLQANVCFDQQQNVWLCSSTDGLVKIPKVALEEKSLRTNQLIMEENILSSYCQENGNYWLGYSNGYVTYIASNGKSQNINLNRGTRTYNRVLDISEDKSGRICFITDEGGGRLIPISNNQFKVEFLIGATGFYSAGKGIFKDNDDNVWYSFGNSYGNFKEEENNAKIKRLTEFQIRQFSHFIDHNNNLYISSSEGIKFLENDKLIDLSLNDSRLKVRTNYFTETKDGTIILATYGEGLIALKNHKLTSQVSIKTGLAGIICRKIINLNDTFYVATNGGISIFTCINGQLKVIRNITASDGLVSNFVNSIFIYNDHIYAATSKGLSILPIHQDKLTSSITPKLSLLSFTVNGENYPLDTTYEFEFSNYHFQINFISQNLSQNTEIVYRYKIRASDQTWIETKYNSLDLSNLPAGHYKIEIQARYKNSDWCASKSISFIIKSPFYLTWWFIILVCSAFLLLLIAFIRFFARKKYRQKLQELETLAAVEKERSRIAADIHDDIGAEVTNIVILSQLSRTQDKTTHFFDKLESSANELINKMNEVIWSLNSQNDTLHNLISYIYQYAGIYRENSSISCRVNCDISKIPDQMVSAELRRNIFLVIKECLNNISKHAKADIATINISINSDELTLVVEDNGIGISNANSNSMGGNGLKNMTKRMKQLNGSIEYKTKIPQGTSITLKANLNPDGRNKN